MASTMLSKYVPKTLEVPSFLATKPSRESSKKARTEKIIASFGLSESKNVIEVQAESRLRIVTSPAQPICFAIPLM
jgi:hypothetical protein